MLKELLDYRLPGNDIDAQNTRGETALLEAVRGGRQETVEFLISRMEADGKLDVTAQINHANKEGMTAVLEACEQGSLTMVQFLVGKGGDVHVRSSRDDGAIELS